MLKGPWLERYEFGAALRAINGPGQPALGLLIWQNKEEKLCIWLKQHQARWILEVDGKLSGTDTAHLEFELSASFDASIWHALRLVRSSDGLTGFPHE